MINADRGGAHDSNQELELPLPCDPVIRAQESMGAFYGNITLKGPSQREIAQALQGRRAVVAPSFGAYTVAFDSICDDQDTDAIQALTARISGEMLCTALAVIVHDDDVLWYSLYRDGELADCYNSRPNYFDSESDGPAAGPKGGIASQLSSIFGVDKEEEVETVLRKEYVFETERHKDLVKLLALPTIAVGHALASFERGEHPEGLSAGQMLWAPKG